MTRRFILLLLSFAFIVSHIDGQEKAEPFFDSLKIVQGGGVPKKVSGQFLFTEGPATDKKGNIFFTDQPNDRIWKYSIAGKLSVFMDKTGRANGLYFDRKGNIIACADEQNQLWKITPHKKVKVIMNDLAGLHFNGPNDLWVHPKGGIYFTDPYYQRDYWKRQKPELDGQRVYYLKAGTRHAILVDSQLVQPNGIVGTPDGKYLYVADIGAWKTYKYQINPDGSLSGRELFVSQGSDGMTLDRQGNLYLAGNGVTVYNKSGIRIAYIPVAAKWVGNLAFGGKDRSTLFITASESVFILPMRVKGVE